MGPYGQAQDKKKGGRSLLRRAVAVELLVQYYFVVESHLKKIYTRVFGETLSNCLILLWKCYNTFFSLVQGSER